MIVVQMKISGFIYSCEAGKTYHIGIRAYDAYANGKNAELYVEKTDEDANTDDSE